MKYTELDTPSLLIDKSRLLRNLADMQRYADENGAALRPHTKTHKCPEIAKMQLEAGACGIAVAKPGEAEVMAQHGIHDIFIANEIVGDLKLRRIAKLAEDGVTISFGVDTPCQVERAERVFAEAGVRVPVLIEIEVGENRSGIIEEADFLALLDTIKCCPMCRSAASSPTTATATIPKTVRRSKRSPKARSAERSISQILPQSTQCPAKPSAMAQRRHL